MRPNPRLEAKLARDLDARRRADRLRVPGVRRAGVDFAGNDYLGLSRHPDVVAAAADAAHVWGTGSTGSRLVTGSTPIHEACEAELSAWLGRPATLLQGSGWQCGSGLLSALAGPDDHIISDALNHASLIDGIRMSRAARTIVPHGDLAALDEALASSTAPGLRIVVTESVFSMDGDLCPLAETVAICRKHDAVLILDEAHALGVIGPEGAGLTAALGLQDEVDIVLGTCGKALAGSGGFLSGSAALRTWAWNACRPFVYSTGLAPPVVAAVRAALALIRDGDATRRLHVNMARLADALGCPVPPAAILPVIVGDDAASLRVADGLASRGWNAVAIRPPTVAPGTARLRLTGSAAHTFEQIDAFARDLHEVLAEHVGGAPK